MSIIVQTLPSHTRQIELTLANSRIFLMTEICHPHPLILASISGSSSRALLCNAHLLCAEVAMNGDRLHKTPAQSVEKCQIAIAVKRVELKMPFLSLNHSLPTKPYALYASFLMHQYQCANNISVPRELFLPVQHPRVPVHLLHHILNLQLLSIQHHLLPILYRDERSSYQHRPSTL